MAERLASLHGADVFGFSLPPALESNLFTDSALGTLFKTHSSTLTMRSRSCDPSWAFGECGGEKRFVGVGT